MFDLISIAFLTSVANVLQELIQVMTHHRLQILYEPK